MIEDANQNRTLSLEEVAAWLSVTPKTVYRLLKKGRIPGFKVGGQWRFNEEMIKRWIADQVAIERLKTQYLRDPRDTNPTE